MNISKVLALLALLCAVAALLGVPARIPLEAVGLALVCLAVVI